MKTILLPFIVLSLFSASALGADECPLDAKGKVIPVLGYDISSMKQQGSKEIYTLTPNAENPYGGPNLVWMISRDKEGRIVRIESGGEKPSPKQIAFELRKNQQLLAQKNLLKKKSTAFALPDAESFKVALGKAEEFPFKFGAVVEMAHSGSTCAVTKLADRLYDHKLQRTVEKPFFSADRCIAINNLYAKFSKDISECSEKYKLHDAEVAGISRDTDIIGNITSGVGGGGGSPIRSIASIIEEDTGDSFKSSLEVEKALCDRLKPLVSAEEKQDQKAPGKSATRQ